MADTTLGIDYHSRILRLWCEQTTTEVVWRFQLIDPQTGERMGFISTEALAQYLKVLTDNPSAQTHYQRNPARSPCSDEE